MGYPKEHTQMIMLKELLQKEYDLGEGDDYPVLAEKFADMGSDMAIEAIRGVIDGSITGFKQDDSSASLSKKILKTDAKLDLEQGVDQLLNKIRAFSDFMTAFVEFRGERIKIFKAKRILEDDLGADFVEFEGGSVNKDFVFKCKDGYFQPLILQKPGKSRVGIHDFLLGFRV